jgi:hypothetical protein
MTGQQPDIQWYIARDGKQHGPLSDVEMRTFVTQGHLKPTDLIWRPGFADWRPAPAVFPFQQPEPPPAAAPAPRPAAQTRQPAATHAPDRMEHSFEPERIRVAQGNDEGRGSGLKRAVGLVTLLLLLGGGGYYVWSAGLLDSFKADAPNGEVPTVEAPDSGAPPAAGTQAEAPAAPQASPQQIDAAAQALEARFAQLPAWVVVKREFPQWYGEQLRQAAALSAQNQPESEVNKQLAQALVTLRRENAPAALAASTPRLKEVATAFLNNLRALANKSVGACYGFISQGETSPAVIEILQSPEQGQSIQQQVATIFEAIADGRRSPTQHDKAVKEDYDVLVQELTKLGWKEQDLQIFSNPQLLSREPPERVCQMVQDWFLAHLSVGDQGAQERLLVETLRPVVSG